MNICTIQGCENPVHGKGYCEKHYRRLQRHGDPMYEKRTRMKRDPICTVGDCKNKHDTKGFCSKHFESFKKYGDPLLLIKEQHGMAKAPIYKVWAGIKTRCYNPKRKAYKYYGGRGIIMCDRWKDSFKNFYDDMGEKPFPKAQIDRIDNDGNYEPSNCRWVTNKENANNRRKKNRGGNNGR